jgi:O-Antigen ligase
VSSRTPASLFIPAAAGSVGAGVLAAESPVLGVGIGGLTILSLLPWAALFGVLVAAAVGNKWGTDVSGVTVRAAQAVLVPFAVRTYLVTRPELRPRWRTPEYVLLAFVVVQLLTSYFNATNFKESFLSAAILALGATTYLSVYTSVCTRRRLMVAARLALAGAALGAGIGVLALLAHLAAGTAFGIDFRYHAQAGGAPAVNGLAYEHDIFGSTCAFAALAFFVLLRERSTLFTRRWTGIFFAMSFVGMLVSLARGAWLGFGAVFVLYFLVRRRRVRARARMVRTALVLLLLALVGAGLFYVANTPDTASGQQNPIFTSVTVQGQNILNLSSGTGAGRIRKYREAVAEAWNESPLIGLGTNSFGQRHYHPSRQTFPYLAPAYLESLYVRTFYDSGVAGLLLLVAFFLTVLWPDRWLSTARTDLAVLARALLFGWTVLAVAYAVTDSMLLVWPWIMLGLIRAAKAIASREERAARTLAPARPAQAEPNGHRLPGPGGNGHRGRRAGGGRPVILVD